MATKSEQRRAQRNEYMRRYRAANPDRVRKWRENHACNVANRVKARSVKGGRDE